MHRVSFGDGAGQWGKQSPGLWEEEKWLKERKKGKAKFCAQFLHQCLMDSYHIALYRLKEV